MDADIEALDLLTAPKGPLMAHKHRWVTVHVATELLAELGDWSPPLQVRLDETPGYGTGYKLTFCTHECERDKARVLRWAADKIDAGPAVPLPPSVYSTLLREYADKAAP